MLFAIATFCFACSPPVVCGGFTFSILGILLLSVSEQPPPHRHFFLIPPIFLGHRVSSVFWSLGCAF